ncbi:iron chelate uptake ABC transporter family permease subunit [Actinomycetaceae bacterium WB03_NA08]|uniref:Iron chelate uptake ABC transporter family permease subunit n=1 Tax=Scrofimicrobium canadense TaxID=2652290 RepID=A0A6N7WAU9_9ACTO|nr:iron chelate uptake ABC transporter family permease subunit [Scrofimicrobium canadense]MSS85346.1 iron chelate uptake ABC transporter family permease subunit [Scrofimicrobium canadense]
MTHQIRVDDGAPAGINAEVWNAAAPPGRVVKVRNVSIIVRPRTAWTTVILLACAVLLGIVAMMVGSLWIPAGEVFAALIDPLRGHFSEETNATVVQTLRLPRVVTGLFAGAALGISGAIFQSVSRNALGSPDVIGFTTGAATGAITQIIIFQGDALAVAASAVIGGFLTALVVYLLSVKGGVTGGFRLILVGIGVGAVLSAANNLLLVMGDLDNAITANIWMSGSLEARKWSQALTIMIGTVVIAPLVIALGRRATLMEMGDDMSSQLGISVERTRLALIALAVILAGLATGAAGPIAFVALAAPQLASRITHSSAVPVVSSAAMGALLLVMADVVTQLLPMNATVPIGRITGVIGGIYLIWLLTRSRQV